MSDAPESLRPSPAPSTKTWLVTLSDGTTRAIEADAFRVEGGALVLVRPAGAVSAFAPGMWTAIESASVPGCPGQESQQ